MSTSPSRSLSGMTRTLIAVAILALLVGCRSEMTIINPTFKYRTQGDEQYAEGNYEEAAGAYRSAVRADPRNYQAHYALGQTYEQLKQYHLAIESYRAGLDVMDTTLEGKENKAFRLRMMDALASSVTTSNERLTETEQAEKRAKASQRAQDYWMLAKIHRLAGDADSAIESYNFAVRLDRKDFALAKEYGLYLVQLQQNRQAELQLKRAYSLNSEDEQVASALRQLGIVPGPALKPRGEMVQPVLPKGPIPEVNIGKGKPTQTPMPAEAAPAPRD